MISFDHSALAIHPLRFNQVEPGTLARQPTPEDADTLPCLLDCAVMRVHQGLHLLTPGLTAH